MRARDTWLLEDVRSFDEPSDWTPLPELESNLHREPREDAGFRSLIEDAEACWQWGAL
jgi:hypothetical protein